MTRHIVTAALAGLLATASAAVAHITPPVILASDRDAVVGLLGSARRYFVREVRLTSQQKAAIVRNSGWTPDADFYRFYVGRDAQGRLMGAVIFVTEYTVHGPVRVAVSIGPDGTIAGAQVVELTEETYAWLKPLIDREFTRAYVGRGGQAGFGLTEQVTGAHLGSMSEFYAEVVASLIRRGAILFDVAGLELEAPGRS